MEWSIEVTTERHKDENARAVFSMVPSDALRESGLPEEEFWSTVKKQLEKITTAKRLPASAAMSYIREASKNRSNEISLVIKI